MALDSGSTSTGRFPPVLFMKKMNTPRSDVLISGGADSTRTTNRIENHVSAERIKVRGSKHWKYLLMTMLLHLKSLQSKSELKCVFFRKIEIMGTIGNKRTKRITFGLIGVLCHYASFCYLPTCSLIAIEWRTRVEISLTITASLHCTSRFSGVSQQILFHGNPLTENVIPD